MSSSENALIHRTLGISLLEYLKVIQKKYIHHHHRNWNERWNSEIHITRKKKKKMVFISKIWSPPRGHDSRALASKEIRSRSGIWPAAVTCRSRRDQRLLRLPWLGVRARKRRERTSLVVGDCGGAREDQQRWEIDTEEKRNLEKLPTSSVRTDRRGRGGDRSLELTIWWRDGRSDVGVDWHHRRCVGGLRGEIGVVGVGNKRERERGFVAKGGGKERERWWLGKIEKKKI